MRELPPDSRITSKIEGEEMVLTIPAAGGASRGWLAGSWGGAAAFAFLAITFIAQGVLSKENAWSVAGMVCGVLSLVQLSALRGIRSGHSGQIVLRVGTERITRITGSAEVPMRTEWLRGAILKLTVSKAGLELQLKDGASPVCILSGRVPGELEWIADQIRLRLKINSDGTIE